MQIWRPFGAAFLRQPRLAVQRGDVRHKVNQRRRYAAQDIAAVRIVMAKAL